MYICRILADLLYRSKIVLERMAFVADRGDKNCRSDLGVVYAVEIER